MEEQKVAEETKKCMITFYHDNPFLQYLHIDVTSIEWGRVRLDMDVKHEHTNVYGIVHGGVTMTMADTAMGAACLACNKRVVTLDCTLNFIRAIPEGLHAYALGKVIHNGEHTMICEAEVYDEHDTLCVKTQATFFVLKEFQ